MEFIETNFSNFSRMVDICTMADTRPLEFEKLTATFDSLTAKLASEQNTEVAKQKSEPEIVALQDRVTSLESLNSTLLTKLDSLCRELEIQRVQNEDQYTLKIKIEDAIWKKHRLEKRLVALSSLLSRSFEQSIKEMLSSPFYFCYCGGKYLNDLGSRIAPELHRELTSRTDLVLKSLLN